MSVAEARRDRIGWSLLGSELRLILTRRRNIIALGVLCGVPIVLALVLATSGATDHTGHAPPLVTLLLGNGLLVVLATYSVQCLIFLPLAMCVLAADSIAGEANSGTLRYLLTVPVGRTRLLLVKYLACCIAAVLTVAAVSVVGAVVGISLFGTGPLITLSGTELPFGEAAGRVAMACGYVMLMQITFLPVALFASTITDQPAPAIVGSLLYVLTDQLLVGQPQLEWLQPYLLTAYWRDWGDLLREPMLTTNVEAGLIVAPVYALVFLSAAWARLTTKDITS